MILESLVKYYEALVEQGELSALGWSQVAVSYALDIDINGRLKQVICLKQENKNGKLVPRKMPVPQQVHKSSNINSNYLCENSTYFLGLNSNGNQEWSKKRFIAAAELHRKNMPAGEDVTTAVNNFFDHWDVEKADSYPELQEYKNDFLKGGNFVFLYEGKFAQDYEAVKQQWGKNYQCETKEKCLCSVTGKYDEIAELHPKIKGIRNAQGAGVSLVSFNDPSSKSYGKDQGWNAQVGQYAAFAYGEALNYLIDKLSYKNYMGDTAILFYALSGEKVYQDAFSAIFLGEKDYYSEHDLLQITEDICEGKMVDIKDKRLDPNMEFYLLGLAPNIGRLSVRFFERGTFGRFVKNIKIHQDRLKIDRGTQSSGKFLTTWQLIQETCRENGTPSPMLAEELTRSIIEDNHYPVTLINAVNARIYADHQINSNRAAIIKAYYLKNENKNIPKEILTMGLNKETNNIPYTLGRLFAVLESIQYAADPDVKATIKDRFFSSVSSTPAMIMPQLIDLAQHHLKKLESGKKIYFDRLLCELLNKLDEPLPKSLNMPERGAFQLGYYHQVQERKAQIKQKKQIQELQ